MTPFQGKLRIRHLEIALSVADLGNLSKAAIQLGMTQSGLSRAIVDMEECVGGKLFDRTSKGMQPTALGMTLCSHAHRLLSEYHKAETDLAAVSRGELGSISIGCFSLFSGWPFSAAIHKFRQNHPRIMISVHTGPHEKLMEELNSGSIDVLLSRSVPGMNPEIYRTTPLLTDSVALVCSPDHPLANSTMPLLEDCVKFPWISAMPESRIRLELEHNLRRKGIPVPSTIGALSIEIGRELIYLDKYLWLLPESIAATYQARGEVLQLPVSLGLTTSPMATIWRRDKSNTRHIRDFSTCIAQVIASKKTDLQD